MNTYIPLTDLDTDERIEARREDSSLRPWRVSADGVLWYKRTLPRIEGVEERDDDD